MAEADPLHQRLEEYVGRQLFRILKFDPATVDLSKLGAVQSGAAS